jgi:lipoprotein signal peptidase
MVLAAAPFIIIYRFSRYFCDKHKSWDGYIIFIFAAAICRIADAFARGGTLDFISLHFTSTYRTRAYIFDFADIYLAVFGIMITVRIILMLAETYEKEKMRKQSSRGNDDGTQHRIPNFANIKKWLVNGLPYKENGTLQNNRLFTSSVVSAICICVVITCFIILDNAKENNDHYIRINGMHVSTSTTELVLSYGFNIGSSIPIWEPFTSADIYPLKHIPGMKTLKLMGHDINNIDILIHLTELEELWLTGNNITEIDVLSHLTQLKILYLGGNQITDISPLKGLSNLQDLWLNGNPLAPYQIDEVKEALPDVNIRF